MLDQPTPHHLQRGYGDRAPCLTPPPPAAQGGQQVCLKMTHDTLIHQNGLDQQKAGHTHAKHRAPLLLHDTQPVFVSPPPVPSCCLMRPGCPVVSRLHPASNAQATRYTMWHLSRGGAYLFPLLDLLGERVLGAGLAPAHFTLTVQPVPYLVLHFYNPRAAHLQNRGDGHVSVVEPQGSAEDRHERKSGDVGDPSAHSSQAPRCLHCAHTNTSHQTLSWCDSARLESHFFVVGVTGVHIWNMGCT